MYREISLSLGLFAIVDEPDYEWLSQWKWCAIMDGPRCYVRRTIRHANGFSCVLMHRLIMDVAPGKKVDHVDGNGLNNTRLNLRIATHAQNMHNRAKRKTATSSQYKGVSRNKQTSKWVANICLGNTPIYLGCFDKEIDAARAYDRAALDLFGAFARVNLVES